MLQEPSSESEQLEEGAGADDEYLDPNDDYCT